MFKYWNSCFRNLIYGFCGRKCGGYYIIDFFRYCVMLSFYIYICRYIYFNFEKKKEKRKK